MNIKEAASELHESIVESLHWKPQLLFDSTHFIQSKDEVIINQDNSINHKFDIMEFLPSPFDSLRMLEMKNILNYRFGAVFQFEGYTINQRITLKEDIINAARNDGSVLTVYSTTKNPSNARL